MQIDTRITISHYRVEVLCMLLLEDIPCGPLAAAYTNLGRNQDCRGWGGVVGRRDRRTPGGGQQSERFRAYPAVEQGDGRLISTTCACVRHHNGAVSDANIQFSTPRPFALVIVNNKINNNQTLSLSYPRRTVVCTRPQDAKAIASSLQKLGIRAHLGNTKIYLPQLH